MQFPVIIDLGTTLAKAHFNINSKGHFCRNLKKHILLGCDVNMLGIVNYVQYNGVVEHKLLPVSSLNISILNETIHQIQFVRAHDSFLILNDWVAVSSKLNGTFFKPAVDVSQFLTSFSYWSKMMSSYSPLVRITSILSSFLPICDDSTQE